MGDKSPKNTAKAKKQHTQQKKQSGAASASVAPVAADPKGRGPAGATRK